MNNNIFDIQRFGKLIKRQWFDASSLKTRNIFPFVLIPVLYLLFNAWKGYPSIAAYDRAETLSILLIVFIVFAPFMYYYNYNHQKKGITDAMLPASSLEKYLVMQLTGIIFAPLLMLVTFGGTDALLSLLFPKVMGGYAVVELVKPFDYNWEQMVITFTAYQSILFCNLWFRKNKPVKTFGVFIAFSIIISVIGVSLFKIFIVDAPYREMNNNFTINGEGSSLMIRPGDHPVVVITQIFRIFIDVIMPIGLTIGSYFMLKTKRY